MLDFFLHAQDCECSAEPRPDGFRRSCAEPSIRMASCINMRQAKGARISIYLPIDNELTMTSALRLPLARMQRNARECNTFKAWRIQSGPVSVVFGDRSAQEWARSTEPCPLSGVPKRSQVHADLGYNRWTASIIRWRYGNLLADKPCSRRHFRRTLRIDLGEQDLCGNDRRRRAQSRSRLINWRISHGRLSVHRDELLRAGGQG